jgi:hypothetical protein
MMNPQPPSLASPRQGGLEGGLGSARPPTRRTPPNESMLLDHGEQQRHGGGGKVGQSLPTLVDEGETEGETDSDGEYC